MTSRRGPSRGLSRQECLNRGYSGARDGGCYREELDSKRRTRDVFYSYDQLKRTRKADLEKEEQFVRELNRRAQNRSTRSRSTRRRQPSRGRRTYNRSSRRRQPSRGRGLPRRRETSRRSRASSSRRRAPNRRRRAPRRSSSRRVRR